MAIETSVMVPAASASLFGRAVWSSTCGGEGMRSREMEKAFGKRRKSSRRWGKLGFPFKVLAINHLDE
jgi:hypothetical protein